MELVESNQVMASDMVNELAEDNAAFMDFVENTIEMLRRSERSFIICSKEGIPPILFKKDKDGIWVVLLSEL